MSANPLLQAYDLPPFSSIRPEHVKPAIERILADNRAAIARLLETQREQPTSKGLVLAMDELNDRLGAAWSPVSHLNAVCNSAELREAYEACLPELSAYSTELGQNRALFEAYEALAKSPEAAGFDVAQKTILEHALRDFRLSGIDLPADKQKRYAEVQSRLSELGSRFSNQLLDATQAWTKHVTDEAALAGLTDSAKAQMKQAAEAKGLDGWLISLEFPSYYAVMTYADDRALREEVYAAYCTRASDQGPNAGQNDNGPVMEEILDLRQELAGLLGFANYAELSLATKMAESSDQVLSFLRDLAVRSKPFAARDLSSCAPTPPSRAAPNCRAGTPATTPRNSARRATACPRRRCVPTSRWTRCFPACSPSSSASTASRSANCTISNAGTPTYACSRSSRTASTSAASTSTSMPAPTSAAVPGWTAPATAGATPRAG